jgi:general secretion pathway protein J
MVMMAARPVCRYPGVQGGFTLLELLIALTLLGLITVMLYGGLHFAIRGAESGERRAEISEQVRLIESFIRREVSQIYPLVWSSKEGKQRVAFKGRSEALHFAAILPAHRGEGGLYLVSIEAVHNQQDYQLIFSYRLARPEIQDFETASQERVVLVDDIERVEFLYYGRQEKEDEARWHSRWKDRNNLPQLVRLRLKTVSLVWPDLVIPIYAEVHREEQQLVMKAPRQSGADEGGGDLGEFEDGDEDEGEGEDE